MNDITWGPAIEVGGVRPYWLQDEERIRLKCADGYESTERCPGKDFRWWSTNTGDRIVSIRLPAHHPNYIPKPPETPATGPNGVLTGVEALEKLEALTRRLAKGFHLPLVNDDGITPQEAVAEAQHIVRVYLKPEIDPDLIKAREIADKLAGSGGFYAGGQYDGSDIVQAALAGIKAGRELGA